MKYLLVLLLLVGTKCLAQQNPEKLYEQFAKDLRAKILYPIELVRLKKPTACLIRILVDPGKTVLEMDMSDSADSTLKAQFAAVKPSLDLKALSNYLRLKYQASKTYTYIIPFSLSIFSIGTDERQAPAQVLNIQDIRKYPVFDGSNLSGEVIFLAPVFREQSVPIR